MPECPSRASGWPVCVYCGTPTPNVLPVCDNCAADLLDAPEDDRITPLKFVLGTVILAIAFWVLNPISYAFNAALWLTGG